MMSARLLALLMVFAPLSMVSFGGGQSTIPEMLRQTVVLHGWLSNSEFANLYAISRAAPGPSSLIAALIGWQVAGVSGALLATVGMFLPAALLMYVVASWRQRHESSVLRRSLQQGLAPIAVGLTFASAATVLRAMHAGPLALATTAAIAVVQSTTRIGTLTLLGAVAAGYLLLFFVLR